MNNGIEILFDSSGAISNIRKLETSFSKLDKKSEESSKKNKENSEQMSKWAMAKAVALGSIMAAGFQKLMGRMFEAIPAIGETLSQIGTVIFRNLFQPLSDVILPLLVRLMNWVRDNRIGFVQMGSVISGAFKAIYAIVSQVFGILKSVFDKFFGALTGGAKTSFKNVTDFLNLMLLKLVFVVQFILILIEPIIGAIADLFVWAYKNAVKPFIEGIWDGMSGVGKAFAEVYDALTPLFEAFSELGTLIGGEGNFIADTFRFLGKSIGQILGAVIKIIAFGLRMIITAITYIVKGISWLINNFKDFGVSVGGAFSTAGDYIKGFFSSIISWIMEKWNGLIEFISSIGTRIQSAVSGAWQVVEDKFKGSVVGKFLTSQAPPAPIMQASGAAGSTTNTQNSTANTTVNINGPVLDPQEARKQAIMGVSQGNSLQNQKAARGQ